MGKLVILLLLSVWAHTSWSGVASAHAVLCRDSDTLHDYLTLKYGEVVVNNGITGGGGLLEVYVNLDTGKWSLVLRLTDGTSCLMGYGENWRGPFILKEEKHVTR